MEEGEGVREGEKRLRTWSHPRYLQLGSVSAAQVRLVATVACGSCDLC